MLKMNAMLSAPIHRNKARSPNASINYHDDEDDDPLLDSSSVANFGRTTMFYNQRQQLRTALKNFFMNPFEKYKTRGRIPWKLIFHILKLLMLTVLLVLFGQSKFQFRHVFNAYKVNLGYLLIKNYAPQYVSDATSNPVIHRKFEIADTTSYSLVNYFNLTNSAVGIFGLNVNADNTPTLPYLCIKKLKVAEIDVSKWKFDIDDEFTTDCVDMDCSNSTVLECRNKVFDVLPESYDGFVAVNTTFQIRSVFLSLKGEPKCVQLYATSTLTNVAMSGGIHSEFDLTYDEVPCNESSTYNPSDSLIGLRETVGRICIDVSVICLSLITTVLVAKRIIFTTRLFHQTRSFYDFHYDRKLSWSETSCFIDGWDILSIVADALTLLGVICKVVLDVGGDNHIDLTAVLIGTAVAINWILALRFLSFDKGYYILVLTINVALPNILRLFVCVCAIYMGFVLCGWVVFGPYIDKFSSISQTTETLFALINGDEILDTFMEVDSRNKLLWVFSKVYFYSVIMLFTYVVLSVTISLISDAMIAAQNVAQTGMGQWLVSGHIFTELQLGWKEEGGGGGVTSNQNLNNNPNTL